ncbi:Serine phosphatase RsbU, regulator of sigma subunit [Cyclonatronum proteinivorum]|uniref:Serine phosphatase RsbU, regulator of sigma subunit n=1 Tax=Cyclonatronum proteinivorum TaxID=1457365 RepID=A0A345UNW6_9BACT|nr:PP2C family protein-serine/threonine phosphatase [Cyclonatronum proteinivorum]AXJ02168.1 Serine phosphatase RsbU, regulator of sigma subunit [Cyclonatronum proteinivorum]
MPVFDNKYITIYRDNDFEAFFETSASSRRKLIYAHLLIYLLPVVLAYVLAATIGAIGLLYWVYTGLAWLMYMMVAIETTAYMYPQSRDWFKKIFPWVIPLLAIGGGWLGFHLGVSAYSGDTETAVPGSFEYVMANDLWRAGLHYAGIMAAFLLVHTGMSLFLKSARVLYTERAELESDVRFAHEVQNRFLQDVSLTKAETGLTAFGRSVPASELGGDYFELSENSDGHLIAAVGDISGHSFGAGLLMSVTRSALQTHLMYRQDPAEILNRLNQMLVKQSGRSMFATMVMLRIDPHSRRIQLSNAGHIPVYHYRAAAQKLKKRHIRGLALGMTAKATYDTFLFEAEPGDLLLICSDGLTETRDETGKIRDFASFETLVENRLRQTPPDATAQTICETLFQHLSEINHAPAPEDDLTLIVIRF